MNDYFYSLEMCIRGGVCDAWILNPPIQRYVYNLVAAIADENNA